MNDAQGFESFQVPKADDLSGIEFAGLLLYFMNPVGLSLPEKFASSCLRVH
jgi:hypothetical protein